MINDRGAGFISRPEKKAWQPSGGKGRPPKESDRPGGGFLGRHRICAALSPGGSANESN